MAISSVFRDRRTLVAALIPLMFGGAACEFGKTETPLSPLVAGPIAGVEITQARGLQPAAGGQIEDKNQPLTLIIENPSSNSPRPFTLRVQIATSGAFDALVHEKSGLAPGSNGQTSYQLPDKLPYGKRYYWRSRAEDGANTGEWSGTAEFQILEPVVIGRPTPLDPIGGVRTASRTPTLVVANGHSTGPYGTLTYRFEASTTSSFSAATTATRDVIEHPSGQTSLTVPEALPVNTTVYWRVMITDGANHGPWSQVYSFVTPLPVVVTPPPSGGAGSASCASGTPIQILTCNRNRYAGQMNSSQIVDFLIQTARDLTAVGVNGAPFGLLEKTSGHQCNGYSCDILCSGNGSGQRQWDILSDAEGAQVPVWAELTGAKVIRPCVIK